VQAVLPELDDREREVLRLRFVEDLPQAKIAARIGCSQMHVSRLLRNTLEQLRAASEDGARMHEAA
jgi:RNA polymerase sigma-B factor